MNVDLEDLWRSGRLTRRHVLQLGAAGLLAPTLVACGDDGGSSTTTTATGPTTTGMPGATTTVDAAAMDRTAILRYGQMRGESYDPIRAVAVEDVQLHAIFDTLVTISPLDGSLGPRLATEWEVLEDRVRLTLREGVVFQDGTPLDAEAVRFSLDRVKNAEDSTIKGFVWQLAGVEVVDDLTVDLLLDPPAALPLLIRLTGRPGMIVSPTAVRAAGSSEAFSNAPIGAGRYKVEGQWFPRESMSVRAWDGYWDPDAQTLGGIDFTEVALNAKVNAILSDAVDIISVESVDLPAVQNQSSVQVLIDPAVRGKGLIVNPTIAPLDDLKVRQAIMHSIDREAAVQAMSQGIGAPVYQPFLESSPAYVAELDDLYPFDRDRARELLEEAGFGDGVTFHSVIGAAAANYVQWGEFLQSQLSQSGITMDLELVDNPRTIPMLYRERVAASSPLVAGGITATETDNYIRNSFLAEGTTNPTGQDVPGVRELLEEAGLQPTPEDAAPYYQEINTILMENVLTMPFVLDPGIAVAQPYVGGLTRGFYDTDVSPELLRGVYITQDRSAAS